MEIKVDQYMIYLYLHTIFGERPIPNIRIKWNLHWSSPPFDKGDAPNFAATRDLLGLDVFSGCCDSFDTSFILFTTSSFSFCLYEKCYYCDERFNIIIYKPWAMILGVAVAAVVVAALWD